MKEPRPDLCAQILAFCATQPVRRVLLAPSRSAGRRILAQCARRGRGIAGVTAHSVFTLAADVCSDVTAADSAPRLLTRLETEQAVLRLLCEPDGEAFPDAWKTPAAARALWRQLEAWELDCSDIPDGRDAALLRALRARLNQYLEETRALTRPALYRLAAGRLERGEVPPPAQEFARLATAELTTLEQRLWDAASGGRETLIEPARPDAAELRDRLRGRCRFVRCRGQENEVRFVFSDLAQSGMSPSRAAVAVPTLEYALAFRREGCRLGVPVAVEGGIPLRHSSLFALLRGLADWRDGDFEAERLIDLLNTPGFAVPAPGALLRRLRGCKVWRGRERYALVWEPLPGDSETLCENRRAWKDFFALVFAALTPGEGQRDALAAFLQAHWRVRDAAAGAAVAQMRAVTAQLCNAGGDLVRLLLESGGDFRYSAAPAENALFCGTFDQCLGTGADVVYAAGLSANEIAARPAVSAFGTVPNAAGKDLALSLRTLLANHAGRAVLIRPDYTSDDLQEQPAALVYTQLRHTCPEETFGFADAPDLPDIPEARETSEKANNANTPPRAFPDFTDWLAQSSFSASALETALTCPYRFYLQYFLQLTEPLAVEPPRSRWLDAGAMGTLVHGALEEYFSRPVRREADAECILALRAEALRRTYPPASDERVAADTARAMALVLTGAKSLAEGSTVAGTEVGFGGAHGDVVVNVGKYALHVNGSIDRIDRLADGSLTILDYKTGDIGKYRDHPERYVQPLLYTLAAEALLGEPGAVRRASYLSLRDGSVLERDMSAEPRAQAAAQLEAFLDLLRANAGDPPRNPCLSWSGGAWETGSEEQRADRRACGTFCPYRGFCRS